MTSLHTTGRWAAIVGLIIIGVATSIVVTGQVSLSSVQISCILSSGILCLSAIILFSTRISRAKLEIIIQNAAITVGSLILTLLLIEAGARAYSVAHPFFRSQEEFRRSEPAPYQNKAYFSQEFITESFKQPGGHVMPKNTILILPNEFDGRFFHVKDGKRVTTDQPADYQHTIYMFGGSTVYCAEVPDAHTLPSELQKLLNEKYGSRYRVENYGVTSVNSTQQVARLKTVEIKSGDIVIFYDGVNDAFLSLFYQEPSATLAQHFQGTYQKFSLAKRFLFDVYNTYHNMSDAVELLLYPYGFGAPRHLEDEGKLADLTSTMQIQYEMNIREAYQYTQTSGGKFYHFLQPQIFTRTTHSHYEQELIDNSRIVLPGTEQVFLRGYPALRTTSLNLARANIHSFDISTALDGRRQQGEEFFLDYAHVNDTANQIIAQAIMDRIFGAQP